jgi:hypothetical protein
MRRSIYSRPRLERLEGRDVPSATPVDLTARGASGAVNGAILRQADPQPTGSGAIDAFLRVQGAAAHGVVQQGYNTDARPLEFDENRSPTFTRALPLSEVPVVNLGGTAYREFLLDINQKSSQPLLSLDEVRLYVGGTGALRGYDPATGRLAGLDPVYDLDAGGDRWVKLDYRLNSGSGSGDMLLYVPAAAFAGGAYVYLYSKFGGHHASNAGFQEWAVGRSPLAATGSISGVKFHDVDGDGVRDAGEVGLGDWVIFLDANDNGVLDGDEAYTITDADGRYTFTGLAAGPAYVYRVREEQQDGWQQTTANPAPIVLLSGEDRDDVDFGNFFVASEN